MHNKKNNKGDNLLISVGKPVAYITQASYTSESKTKLKFNYDLLENELYPIERLRFTFTDTQGKELATITEYYPDKILYLKVPQGFKGTKKFMVSTRVMLRSKRIWGLLPQDIMFDVHRHMWAKSQPAWPSLDKVSGCTYQKEHRPGF